MTEKVKGEEMRNIELEKIGLSYYDKGINKKIHTLINENVKCHITYREEERKIQYEDHNKRQSAYWAGYNEYYMKKIPIKWEYNINSLIKFFKKNDTVIYYRKKVKFDNLLYIKKLEEIKKKNKGV